VEAAEVYRISAGDVLRVDVGRRTDLSGQYAVSEGGTITMPGVGAIRAQGRTTIELADDISRRLSLVEREISSVTVTLLESAARKVLVLGAVLLPGSYPYTSPISAWEAITLAGGAEQGADLSAVEIIPQDGGVAGRASTIVDLGAAVREGRVASLEKLRPGDTVRVPRAGATTAGTGNQVYVFGAVAAQGAVPLDQAPDLLSVLLRVGGPAQGANLKEIEIVRRDGSRLLHLRVNLEEYLKQSSPAGNIPLRAGDTVYLTQRAPRARGLFSVLGVLSPLLALATTLVAIAR
jgi:polysaccharide export outer membrane protein